MAAGDAGPDFHRHLAHVGRDKLQGFRGHEHQRGRRYPRHLTIGLHRGAGLSESGHPPDVVSIPIGQGHGAGDRYSKGRGANVLSILSADLTDGQTGALAWAATRVNIEKTGEWNRLPKFENAAPDLAEDEEHHIIQLTSEDS